MIKYYKNNNGDLFKNPIVKNHAELTEITKEEYDNLLDAVNNPPKTDEDIYNDDWAEINKYFDTDIPKYTNPDTNNIFDITSSSLVDMERKEKLSKEDAVIYWSTDKDNEFITSKAELFIVLQKAEELRQLKVNEVRGL